MFLARPEEPNIPISEVNKEISKLILDVETFSDLTMFDYVKRIRNTEAWKKIKANQESDSRYYGPPRKEIIKRIKDDYIARYKKRKYSITFSEIQGMDLKQS